MSKKDEALKLALEALECDPLEMALNPDGHMGFRKDQAITAIREALADSALDHMAENARELGIQMQPAQGCEFCSHSLYAGTKCKNCGREQPAQQPVAMRYDFDGYGYKYIDAGSGSDWQTRIKDAEPVYASPQPAQQQEHITDGTPCWCNPVLDYKDPDTGAEVWIHKEPQ